MPDIVAFLHHLCKALVDILELDDHEEILGLEDLKNGTGEQLA